MSGPHSERDKRPFTIRLMFSVYRDTLLTGRMINGVMTLEWVQTDTTYTPDEFIVRLTLDGKTQAQADNLVEMFRRELLTRYTQPV